jgi:hypothetical protein
MSPNKARAEAYVKANQRRGSGDLQAQPADEVVQAIRKHPKGKPLTKTLLSKTSRLTSRRLSRLGKSHLTGEDERTLKYMADIKATGELVVVRRVGLFGLIDRWIGVL